MGGEQPKTRSRMLGPMMALVGFTAATVEILNYFEVKPRDFGGFASRVLPNLRPGPSVPPETSKGPDPSPGKRPIQLVLIVKNTGDREDMKRVIRAASRFATRLIHEDSVSLISFVNGRHVWVFQDEPGDHAREEIERRAKGLFPASKIPLQTAVDDALRLLKQDRKPGKNSAIVVLSASSDEDNLLDRWAEQVRTHAESHERVLVAAGDSIAGSR